MRKIKIVVSVITFILACAFKSDKLVNWKIKEGYRIKHVESGGLFTGLKAEIWFDESKPANSKINAQIDAGSIDAGGGTPEAKKTLDVEKFPVIRLVSTAIKKTGPGQFDGNWKLTLKGVTKEIKFSFNFDSKKSAMRYPIVPKETFGGTFTISPKDFNLDMGESEKCTIELIIPVSKE